MYLIFVSCHEMYVKYIEQLFSVHFHPTLIQILNSWVLSRPCKQEIFLKSVSCHWNAINSPKYFAFVWPQKLSEFYKNIFLMIYLATYWKIISLITTKPQSLKVAIPGKLTPDKEGNYCLHCCLRWLMIPLCPNKRLIMRIIMSSYYFLNRVWLGSTQNRN